MDHKGIRYELLQTVHPFGWKWVAHVSHAKQITGFSGSKDLAINAAQRAIEKALEEADDKKQGRLIWRLFGPEALRKQK